jgi:hypothetical protein
MRRVLIVDVDLPSKDPGTPKSGQAALKPNRRRTTFRVDASENSAAGGLNRRDARGPAPEMKE